MAWGAPSHADIANTLERFNFDDVAAAGWLRALGVLLAQQKELCTSRDEVSKVNEGSAVRLMLL